MTDTPNIPEFNAYAAESVDRGGFPVVHAHIVAADEAEALAYYNACGAFSPNAVLRGATLDEFHAAPGELPFCSPIVDGVFKINFVCGASSFSYDIGVEDDDNFDFDYEDDCQGEDILILTCYVGEWVQADGVGVPLSIIAAEDAGIACQIFGENNSYANAGAAHENRIVGMRIREVSHREYVELIEKQVCYIVDEDEPLMYVPAVFTQDEELQGCVVEFSCGEAVYCGEGNSVDEGF